ncbi:hypothetical protein FACS1894104_3890 [Actinomycetota bacterium]|nr:hypothetical protein FACS1894104_3890 [Actinomycetota bacterium]
MPEQNLILAFDTSSDYLACAIGELSADGTITLLACADQPARREANVKLLPAIDGMLTQAGLKKSKVQAVVCGLGPGSFTGVRIAVASAKGIARGLGVPLYGVSTLDSIAWAAWLANVHGTLGVVADAMRGEIYPARFTLDVTGVQRLDSHTVAKAADIVPKWSAEKNLQLTGDGLYKFSKLFCGFEVLPEALWVPTGAGVLRAFEAKLSGTGTKGTGRLSQSWDKRPVPFVPGTTPLHSSGNPATLLPIYTRLADAEENERRRLAAGGEIAQGALVEVPASGVNDVASAASAVGTVNATKVANTASTACASRQTESPLSPTGAVFRPAANQDLDAMTVLEEQLFAKELVTLSGECWSRKMFADDLPRKDRSWWVCYANNQLAGFAGGQVLDGQLHVMDLAVAEQYRHQGIASKLVFLLAEDGKALGATSITLEVRATNTAAQNLYKKLGLLQQGVRPRYYAPEHIGEPRVDAVIMTGAIESVSAFTHLVPAFIAGPTVSAIGPATGAGTDVPPRPTGSCAE